MRHNGINTAVGASLQAQRECNRQYDAINANGQTMLAHIEALIARMLPSREYGREACLPEIARLQRFVSDVSQ